MYDLSCFVCVQFARGLRGMGRTGSAGEPDGRTTRSAIVCAPCSLPPIAPAWGFASLSKHKVTQILEKLVLYGLAWGLVANFWGVCVGVRSHDRQSWAKGRS
jgi:hypothetical protein